MTPYPHPIIAKEGWPFLGIGLFLSCARHRGLGLVVGPVLAATLFMLQFFRDPPRSAPGDADAVISPADGRIVAVEKTRDPYLDRNALKISVFMNVFNVHSNRSPVDGEVRKAWYFGGRFLNKWRGRMPSNGRLRVGICWAGSATHLNDRNRSIALERFATLLSVPGIDFVSVQKEASELQSALLGTHGVVQLGQEFTDLADTAAVLAKLDLLISVDTSVAHLAGAMGKAVALLLPFAPDFRWLLDRTDSPWYPTMRLYRQPAIGDWEAPLLRLRQELAAVTSRPGDS